MSCPSTGPKTFFELPKCFVARPKIEEQLFNATPKILCWHKNLMQIIFSSGTKHLGLVEGQGIIFCAGPICFGAAINAI